MASQKDKHPSMFFSTHLTEKKADFLALYFDQDQWGKLFELVKEFDSFSLIKKNADEFLLKIGQHEFNVTRDFHRCIITLGQISTLKPGACELLAKIADLIFYDRKHRFLIDSSNAHYEEMMWEVCFQRGISLKPANKAQAGRFQMWAARKNIQDKTTLGFSQRSELQAPNPAQPKDPNMNPDQA